MWCPDVNLIVLSDLQAIFDPGSDYPNSDSLWRPVRYEDAFKGTPYYKDDLAGKDYIVLQHWAECDRTQAHPTRYNSGRYFVIEYDDLASRWKYCLGSLQTSFCCGLFKFC